jgi:sterol desaturase/sphingolipid hydroxylase (fatty acid hydroxylase superfamily)
MSSTPFARRVDHVIRDRTVKAGAWALVVAILTSAVWLIGIALTNLIADHQLTRTLLNGERIDVGPLILGFVAVIFFLEQRWPAVPRPALARGHILDGMYLLLFIPLAPLVTLLNTGFAIELREHAPWLILSRLPFVPQIVVVLLILIGIDVMNWISHVANHRYEALWRLHALHHSQEDMSVLTTFRTHPLAHASYLLAVAPALVLSASGVVPVTALIVYGGLVTLPHANLRWTFGWLGKWVCNPAYHRLHHARRRIDGHLAVNYGFVLTIWDRLASLAAFDNGDTPVTTGLAGRPVPVENANENVLHTLFKQISQPFRMGAQ